MDHLPPTIPEKDLLLLGKVLSVRPQPDAIRELRLTFFRPDFSWQSLANTAAASDVLPILYFALNQHGLLLPVPESLNEMFRSTHVTSRLSAAYALHLARQEDLRGQLIAILKALHRRGIVPLLLKGAANLTAPQGNWREARSMRDLDLLVRPSEATIANEVLLSMGYDPEPDPPPFDRHYPSLRRSDRSGSIEIHIEGLSFTARPLLTTDEIWARVTSRGFAGTMVEVLPSEWHLLHGMLHHQMSDRGYERRLLAVKALWEFAMLGSELSPLAWKEIIGHLERRGVLDLLGSWALQASRLFDFNIPEGLALSESARKHARATFRRARAPYLIRSLLFFISKAWFGFHGETLAARYGLKPEDGFFKPTLRHALFLLRRYRRVGGRHWFGN